MAIKITEVGPRDGLQNEPIPIPTEKKFEFIQKLFQAGLKNIEATSFVRPDRVPQLSDSEALSTLLNPKESPIHLSCLVPNLKGYEKAVKFGYKEVAVFTATSETFNQKNINQSIANSLKTIQEITFNAKKDNILVRGYLSTVIVCPYEGWISPENNLPIIEKLLELGVYEVSLGETIGKATPSYVEKLLTCILKKFPKNYFAVHFHDTYGMAIANAKKALEMGITSFDSSAGGLGGCPYAPGAAGNVATEDLVYLLEKEGYPTQIQLHPLMEAVSIIKPWIDRPILSKVHIAITKSCTTTV